MTTIFARPGTWVDAPQSGPHAFSPLAWRDGFFRSWWMRRSAHCSGCYFQCGAHDRIETEGLWVTARPLGDNQRLTHDQAVRMETPLANGGVG